MRTFTTDERIARETWRTVTLKRSRLVGAHGVGAARVGDGALVNVDASHFGISAEARRALAKVSAVRVGARAATSARVDQLAFVNVSTLQRQQEGEQEQETLPPETRH